MTFGAKSRTSQKLFHRSGQVEVRAPGRETALLRCGRPGVRLPSLLEPPSPMCISSHAAHGLDFVPGGSHDQLGSTNAGRRIARRLDIAETTALKLALTVSPFPASNGTTSSYMHGGGPGISHVFFFVDVTASDFALIASFRPLRSASWRGRSSAGVWSHRGPTGTKDRLVGA